jgi:carboxypeptidase C (cathepsin A)
MFTVSKILVVIYEYYGIIEDCFLKQFESSCENLISVWKYYAHTWELFLQYLDWSCKLVICVKKHYFNILTQGVWTLWIYKLVNLIINLHAENEILCCVEIRKKLF